MDCEERLSLGWPYEGQYGNSCGEGELVSINACSAVSHTHVLVDLLIRHFLGTNPALFGLLRHYALLDTMPGMFAVLVATAGCCPQRHQNLIQFLQLLVSPFYLRIRGISGEGGWVKWCRGGVLSSVLASSRRRRARALPASRTGRGCLAGLAALRVVRAAALLLT